MFLTASIGIAVSYGSEFDDAATLIRDADTAMYHSKDAGRNSVTVFDVSMLERIAKRVEMERRIRHALSAGDIVAHYQPIVQLPSGNVIGFEALARWNDGGKMVEPAEFIAVAEECGLIVPLGALMLDEACRSLSQWRRTIPGGEQLYMSVNLSPRQVRESDIVDTVADALLHHDLPGDALWLEITESLVMENPEHAADILDLLRAAGAGLSLDDFGAGYSSLSYLQRFSFDTIKIDRSIVHTSANNAPGSAIVRSIVALSHELGRKVVAEGVENGEDVGFLRSISCEYAQGFYYGEPMPPREVMQLLKVIRKSERKLQRRGFFRTKTKLAPQQRAANGASHAAQPREAAPPRRAKDGSSRAARAGEPRATPAVGALRLRPRAVNGAGRAMAPPPLPTTNSPSIAPTPTAPRQPPPLNGGSPTAPPPLATQPMPAPPLSPPPLTNTQPSVLSQMQRPVIAARTLPLQSGSHGPPLSRANEQRPPLLRPTSGSSGANGSLSGTTMPANGPASGSMSSPQTAPPTAPRATTLPPQMAASLARLAGKRPPGGADKK
mgnify:CR=1 FL=1